jgi:hypothetical protein
VHDAVHQVLQQPQPELGNLGNNQGQDAPEQAGIREEVEAEQGNAENENVEEENPNAPWDFLAAQNAPIMGWDEWLAPQAQNGGPVDLLAQNGGPVAPQAQNLNHQAMEIDLNNALPDDDMQEVIIHPVAVPEVLNGEVNDLAQNAVEEAMQMAEHNPVLDLNNLPVVQDLAAFIGQDQPQMQFPHLPIEPVIDEEDEIPLHMLLDGNDSDQEEDQHADGAPNYVLNVGTVLLREKTFADPVLLQRQSFINSECSNQWLSTLDKIPGKKVMASAQWAPLFTSLLLSPGNYKWAKSFIESEAWDFFSKSLTTTLIKVPDHCLDQNIHCIKSSQSSRVVLAEIDVDKSNQNDQSSRVMLAETAVDESNQHDQAASTELAKEECQFKEAVTGKKDRKKRNPVVESEVRRSPRLKDNNKGFKPGSCVSRKCSTCSPTPPDLSLDLIRKLGTNLCQIEDDLLTESSLNQKKGSTVSCCRKKT